MNRITAACPYCRAPFEPEDEITICEACATPHHADCYSENGGCTVFGCSKAPVDEPKISVTASEARHVPYPSAPPGPTTVPTPPPPRSPGNTSTVPPPPRPFVFQAFNSYAPLPPAAISFGGYNPPAPAAYSPYIRRRNRLTYILLGVLLGPFGIHNFYAGYIQRAVVQLLLTVLSCFFGGVISWIWAIVEVCTVKQDDDGIAFI